MAAILGQSLIRQIGKKLRTIAGVRKLSTDGAKFCMIMGEKGAIAYDICEFEPWEDYVQHTPILKFIPTNGLYGSLYDPRRPYSIADDIRKVLRTSALTVHNANKCGLSLVNPFFDGNVGVLKSSGCIAFKSFQMDPSDTWKLNKSAGYSQVCTFFKDSISDTIGDSALSQLPLQLESYFKDLEDPAVTEDLIIDNPATLPTMVYADVCCEACRFLIKGWSSVPRTEADTILSAIGLAQPNALNDCLNHEILHQFLPRNLQKVYPASSFPFTNVTITPLTVDLIGGVIVEVCRHSAIHAEDSNVRSLVSKRLNISSYSREDVTDLVRAVFPNFLRDSYNSMVATKHWDKLDQGAASNTNTVLFPSHSLCVLSVCDSLSEQVSISWWIFR